jgi:hypothetical protein
MDSQIQSQGQTKKCPKCGEEIQLAAKVCKHCSADLQNWFFKHKVLTVILILFIIGIIGSIGSDEAGKMDKNVPATSDSNSNQTAPATDTKPEQKPVSLNNNNPNIKQLGTLTSDYVGQSFVLNVDAETSDYYNYGFRDETKYYSLKIWDDSVSGSYEGIYAYIDKNDTNKELVNALLDSGVQLEVHVSIPTTKWESGSNAFLKIDSWKSLK